MIIKDAEIIQTCEATSKKEEGPLMHLVLLEVVARQ